MNRRPLAREPNASNRGASARRAVERGTRVEYLAFRLADDVYAAPIAFVKEILKLPPVTEVPRAPADVLGVVSVRGRIVTVRDLRRRLRLSEGPVTRRSRILLCEQPPEEGALDERIGLFVDEVLQVYRFADEEIESSVDVLGGDLAECVSGVGRQRGDMILLLDLRPILGGARPAGPVARPGHGGRTGA